ncbi:MAG: AraC family transcriptional regulator ligand-binding domain-containing protein [Akkermansiaceae bacterium]|nr:AraC family transcriptional regulator ligand-binding domain-containing protein [Akkermansiaceae bacterium]
MHRFHLTQAAALRPGIEALLERGVNVDAYLERSRIPPQVIHQSYAPLTKRGHFWHFLDSVETGEGIETLGFLFGDPLDLSSLGTWGRRILRSHSLFEAFAETSRTIHHVAQGNSLRITRANGTARVTVVNEERIACRAADHTALNLLLTITGLVADEGWRPASAALRTERREQVEALPWFESCHLHFDQRETSLDIPEEFLSRPLPQPHLDPLPDTPMLELPDGGGIAPKLQVLIAALLPYHGPLPAEDAAAFLGVSRTTLFRLLTHEGESYRRIVENVRYRVARRLLAEPSSSVKEVSYVLGYHTPNNFIRAFRRVAGIPPGMFRDRVLGGAARVA